MSDTPIHGAHFKPDDSAESFFASTPEPAPASRGPRVADQKYLSARLERDARQGRRRGGRIAICVVAAILVAFIGVFAFTAVTALGHARAAASSAKSAVSALISGDVEGYAADSQAIERESQELHQVAYGPVWSAASHLPGIGQDIRNTQSLADILLDVSQNVLTPLSDNDAIKAASVTASADQSGEDSGDHKVNVAVLVALAQSSDDIGSVLQRSETTVDDLQRGVIPQLNNAVAMTKSYLSAGQVMFDMLEKYSDIMPELLGANGPRSYLLIAQNSAELRPTGGIPGSWGVVTVDNGNVSIGSMGEPDLWTKEGISLTKDDINLMGEYYGYMKPDIFWVSANFNPDFPSSAQNIAEYWRILCEEEIQGMPTFEPAEVDGVVAVNPILVQNLLGLTDGFDMDFDGTSYHIDGTNATEQLLSAPYWAISKDRQNEFFSEVAASAMSTVLGGLSGMDPSALLDVLEQSGEHGDIQVWFKDAELERAVCQLGYGGEVKTTLGDAATVGTDSLSETGTFADGYGTDSDSDSVATQDSTKAGEDDEEDDAPVLGTFFYDITWSKMDWYLNASTEVGEPVKNSDGTTSYQVKTTLINEMNEEDAANAPESVVGIGDNPIVKNKGGMATVVYLYAPVNSTITNLKCNSGTFSNTTVSGLDVYHGCVVLDPQKREEITYTVTLPEGVDQALEVRSTPTVREVAGYTDHDPNNYELEDSSSYGSVTSKDAETINNLISRSTTSVAEEDYPDYYSNRTSEYDDAYGNDNSGYDTGDNDSLYDDSTDDDAYSDGGTSGGNTTYNNGSAGAGTGTSDYGADDYDYGGGGTTGGGTDSGGYSYDAGGGDSDAYAGVDALMDSGASAGADAGSSAG